MHDYLIWSCYKVHICFFFKMCQSRPLYLFIFVLFTFKFNWQIYSLKLKKHRWCAWDSNPGRQDGRRRRIHWAMVAPLKVHICYWLVKRTKIMVSILIQEFTRGHFFASILEVDGRYSFVDLWIWKSEKLNMFCGFVDLKKWKIEQVLWICGSEKVKYWTGQSEIENVSSNILHLCDPINAFKNAHSFEISKTVFFTQLSDQ